MESEPDCLLYFSIPTPVHESSTLKKKKQSLFFFSCKDNKIPKEVTSFRTVAHSGKRERRRMICDDYKQSLVCTPQLPIHLRAHLSFSLSVCLRWIAGETVKNWTPVTKKRLVWPWTVCDTEQKYVPSEARRVSQASTAASVKWLAVLWQVI